MVMSTRIGVGDSTISESRTIPLPENSTARPLRKPVPLTSRVFLTGLRSANTMFGLTDDTGGAGGEAGGWGRGSGRGAAREGEGDGFASGGDWASGSSRTNRSETTTLSGWSASTAFSATSVLPRPSTRTRSRNEAGLSTSPLRISVDDSKRHPWGALDGRYG